MKYKDFDSAAEENPEVYMRQMRLSKKRFCITTTIATIALLVSIIALIVRLMG